MKKLIDIDENNLCAFRRIVSLHFPEIKLTDKMLVNLALYIAYCSIKNNNKKLDYDFLGLCKHFINNNI